MWYNMRMFYQLTNKSFESEGVTSHKELWEKVKSNHRGFCLTVNTDFQKTYDDEDVVTNRFHVIMSTAVEDRHGEIVFQNWDLENFKKNPVFLDSHNYGSIEHIIGKVHNISQDNGRLEGDIEFALDNPKGALAFKLALGGFLNATSVGFIPKNFDDKGNITSAELLEDSAVSVPANAQALFEKSFDQDTEIAIMKDGRVLSKTNLQRLKTAMEAIGEVIKSAEDEKTIEKDIDVVETKEEGESIEAEVPLEENAEIIEEKKLEVKSQTPDVYKVLIKTLQDKNAIIREVAKQLDDTKPTTLAERKRKILRDLRSALKV